MTAHKNSGNSTANHWRREALFVLLLLMIANLFFSRALLSISIVLFVIVAIVQKDFVQLIKRFITTPYLVFFSLLFFIPAISGLWSSNLNLWADVVRIKLPLLVFPLAFAANWQFSAKQWNWLAAVFLVAVFGGCVWGLADYWQNPASMHEAYLRAKTISTPLENDHVRFSWLVAVAIILCCLLFVMSADNQRRVFLSLLAVFFIIYLHVLSARTGLLSFYIFLLLGCGWLFRKHRKNKWSIGGLFILAALPVISFFALPTFRARVDYFIYDWSYAGKGQYLPGSSDGARTMSLKAGWQMLKENPWGVGAGDIISETDKWYAANVPQVLPTDKFYPSSEWLMYGGFAGWAGAILFTAIMLLPFLHRPTSHPLFWLGLHATAAASFLFDMGLEVQYGVFLYAFVVFWWWKWLGDIQPRFPKFASS
jgi:hypothetical protein